jgi:hypothetical protein
LASASTGGGCEIFLSFNATTTTHEEKLHAMTATTPAAAWADDPTTGQAPDIRRANLAQRRDISDRISDAAQMLLSLRQWASPEEATAMISAIQSVAYTHAQMQDACGAHDAVRAFSSARAYG